MTPREQLIAAGVLVPTRDGGALPQLGEGLPFLPIGRVPDDMKEGDCFTPQAPRSPRPTDIKPRRKKRGERMN